MSRIFALKYTNFSALKDKIQKKSEQLKFKDLQVFDDKVEFDWNNSFLGLTFKVIIVKIDDKTLMWAYDLNGLMGLILFLALILFFALKNSLIIYFLSLIVIGLLIYFVEKQSVDRAIVEFLNQIDKQDDQLPDEHEQEQTTGLRCPACGEPLTEYDEFCPSCGLFLGKTWKKQPSHRTGLYNVRLVYRYKKRTDDDEK